MSSYKIVRYYMPKFDGKPEKPSRTIKTGLTEEEAQEHCSRDDTKKDGVYFEGYVEE